MFIAYMKFAFRSLYKQGFRSLINILGLGFGIACCLLIYMYAREKLSYDDFHKHGDRIYRMYGRYVQANGETGFTPYFNYNLAKNIYDDVPGIEASCGLRSMGAWIGMPGELYNERVGFTDSSFLDMFTFPVIAGDPNSPFAFPQSVILTESVAVKIFGDSITDLSRVIGESVHFPQPPPNEFTVTAIIADPPGNNSIWFDVLVPYANARYYPQCSNSTGNTSIYIMVDKTSDPGAVLKNIHGLTDKYLGEGLKTAVEFGILADIEDNFLFMMQPLSRLYLHSEGFRGCYEQTGNIRILYILTSIAVLILLIAGFNYVMLSIGYSMNRIRDLGMMNVAGARKGQIIRHFISESFLLTLLALFLGIILAEQLLPLFNILAGEHLKFSLYDDWKNILFMALLGGVIVLVTGTYTGWFLLRRNQPVRHLRKELLSLKRHRFARFFVVFQYLVTITLLVLSGLIFKQLKYMIREDVGYDRQNLVVLPVDFPEDRIRELKAKLLQYPQIMDVSMSDRNFVAGAMSNDLKNDEGELVNTRFLRIDKDYVKTIGLQLVDGRDFSGSMPIDSNRNVLVNEAFVRAFGLESPVGRVIETGFGNMKVTIIGVVRDFHFDSMHRKILPLMMSVNRINGIWSVFVRIDPEDVRGALDVIEKTWKEVVPEFSYDYGFLSDMLGDQYRGEDRMSRITAIASLIAIFLSCLGLLGISGLLVARRIKEIGIRKANGATVLQVVLLLNRDILKWIALAFVFACPLAWYIGNRWLQDFAYKTGISWWLFALAGMLAVIISLLTVSWQTFRAANRNPVTALRYE